MAASEQMAISVLLNRGISSPGDAQIRALSTPLRQCLDTATSARGFGGEPPLDLAAVCMLQATGPP
jgi:hypothetical protein